MLYIKKATPFQLILNESETVRSVLAGTTCGLSSPADLNQNFILKVCMLKKSCWSLPFFCQLAITCGLDTGENIQKVNSREYSQVSKPPPSFFYLFMP